MPVSQLSTLPPVRAGSAQVSPADLTRGDHTFLSWPARSPGPPRPARAFPQEFSQVLSLMLLPCLKSPASCAGDVQHPAVSGPGCCPCAACSARQTQQRWCRAPVFLSPSFNIKAPRAKHKLFLVLEPHTRDD